MVHRVNQQRSSALHQLVEAKLGMPLKKWIKKSGLEDASYRTIARKVHEETGLKVGKSTVYDWLTE